MPWRQLSPRRQTDKAIPWFSLLPLSRIEGNPMEAKHTGSQDGGGTGHELNSQKCVCFAGRCLLDMIDGSWNPATL